MDAKYRPDRTIKAKPRGAAANVMERNERLNALSAKAIRFWEKTLDEKGDATTAEKIQVSKLVVEYAWGKPKQQVQVDARVEINHKAHIEALHLLADAARGPIIDANPLNQLDNPSNGPNQPLLSNSLNPTDLVEIGQGAALAGLGLANPTLSTGMVGIEDPPPEGRGTPGGGLVHGHPRPLDLKNDE